MTKIKILVVEDESVVAMMIADLLEDLGYEVLEPISNYKDAIECLNNEQPDIAILDIDLKSKKSGIDIAHYINKNIQIPFIFLTSLADSRTVDQAKKLNPPAYLMKPFKSDDLYTSIEMALYNFKPNTKCQKNFQNTVIKDAFFVKGTHLFHKVKFSEILFAKSEHIYVELQTREGQKHLVRSNMNDLIENLPANFFRVHRSYIINLDYLDSINQLYIIIQGRQIPIGKNYRQLLLQLINIK